MESVKIETLASLLSLITQLAQLLAIINVIISDLSTCDCLKYESQNVNV